MLPALYKCLLYNIINAIKRDTINTRNMCQARTSSCQQSFEILYQLCMSASFMESLGIWWVMFFFILHKVHCIKHGLDCPPFVSGFYLSVTFGARNLTQKIWAERVN